MKVKICGITRLEDAEAAVSGRRLGDRAQPQPARARGRSSPPRPTRIGNAMKRRCEVAGIFVNQPPRPDRDRGRGGEQLTLCSCTATRAPRSAPRSPARPAREVIKAFRVRNPADVTAAREPSAPTTTSSTPTRPTASAAPASASTGSSIAGPQGRRSGDRRRRAERRQRRRRDRRRRTRGRSTSPAASSPGTPGIKDHDLIAVLHGGRRPGRASIQREERDAPARPQARPPRGEATDLGVSDAGVRQAPAGPIECALRPLRRPLRARGPDRRPRRADGRLARGARRPRLPRRARGAAARLRRPPDAAVPGQPPLRAGRPAAST